MSRGGVELEPRPMRRLLPVLLVVGGAWNGVWRGSRMLAEARSTAEWHAVTGRIESTRVEFVDGPQRPSPFAVEVEYSYEVAGRTYRGTRQSVAGNARPNSREEAERLAAGWPEGSEVAVYHDPRDPALAALQRGGGQRAGLRLVLGVALVGAGVALGLRRRS